MLTSELESVRRSQFGGELAEAGGRDFGDAAAVVTHRVGVYFVAERQVVNARAVGQMHVVDDAGVFERAEVAIDGRGVDTRKGALYAHRQLVGGDVSTGADERVDDGAARRRHPSARGADAPFDVGGRRRVRH